jgi:hypothetical protein
VRSPVVSFLSSLVLVFLLAPVVPQHPPSNDLLLILDASGSMWGRAEGEEKIVIARRVLKDLASTSRNNSVPRQSGL